MTLIHNTNETARVNAVVAFVEAWAVWLADTSVVRLLPDSDIRQRLSAAHDVCSHGDVGTAYRPMCDAVARMTLEMELYDGGRWVAGSLEPTNSLYAVASLVVNAVALALAFPVQHAPNRSVGQLKADGLNNEQIARVFGRFNASSSSRWEGPLFTSAGAADEGLIIAELNEPWSYLSRDAIHPVEAARIEAVQQLAKSIATMTSQLDEASKSERSNEKPKPTREQIVFYLREGGFPHQLLHDYTTTVEDIEQIAREAGIIVGEVVTPVVSVTTTDAEIQEAIVTTKVEAEAEPSGPSGSSDFVTPSPKARAIELRASGMGSADIADKLTVEFGKLINHQRVAAWLRNAMVPGTV